MRKTMTPMPMAIPKMITIEVPVNGRRRHDIGGSGRLRLCVIGMCSLWY